MPLDIARVSRFPFPVDPDYELAVTDRDGRVTNLNLKRGQYEQMGGFLMKPAGEQVSDPSASPNHVFPTGVMHISARASGLDFNLADTQRLEIRPSRMPDVQGEMVYRIAQGGLGALVLLFLMI